MKFLVVTDFLGYIGGGFEPLSVMYVMSAVRQAGHEVKMIEDDFQKASAMIEDWKPDFVGYSAFTGYHKQLIDLNRRLKERHEFISLFGGPHPTFFPEMVKEEGVDIVCRGEGEEAVVELLDSVQRGEDYSGVRNFWIKLNGQIHRNEVRPLQDDLDKIAFPARDLFYQFPQARNSKVRIVNTARGCPYACTYCYNYKIKELYKSFGAPHLRHRGVDSIIEEILQLKAKYPIEFVYFGTDNFTTLKDWVFEFSEKYRRKLNIPFLCGSRPETISPEVCRALKSANCASVYMGIESGNEEIRRNLLNRKMNNDRIITAAQNIHEAGLKLATFNMMLFPGETLEQAWDTLTLNQRCRSDYAWVSLFQPYPRTKLADYAIEKGYFDGDFDRLQVSWYRFSALSNHHKKKFERLQKLVWLAVEFRWLTPLVKLAMKLPFSPIYMFLLKLHKAYCYRFRVMPVKLSFREVLKLSWRFLVDRSE
ncbi:MAG: B12-binding domain-containing radical SAM protein [candidate division Zixibacteria bacterium]|nr:B12-binding domain-containing radical SAM protein [Candidatus Tariuqbacter arcticus]